METLLKRPTLNVARAIQRSMTPCSTFPISTRNEWRDTPVRHRYVHGGFTGTEAKFAFYLPPKEQYQGRFFQYITPVPVPENASGAATGENSYIGFSISSDGSYRTISGFENTDAWDGVVPFIMGSNQSIPSMFTARVHALRVLGDKFPGVVDALDPGGSGDMYAGGTAQRDGDAATPYTRLRNIGRVRVVVT